MKVQVLEIGVGHHLVLRMSVYEAATGLRFWGLGFGVQGFRILGPAFRIRSLGLKRVKKIEFCGHRSSTGAGQWVHVQDLGPDPLQHKITD